MEIYFILFFFVQFLFSFLVFLFSVCLFVFFLFFLFFFVVFFFSSTFSFNYFFGKLAVILRDGAIITVIQFRSSICHVAPGMERCLHTPFCNDDITTRPRVLIPNFILNFIFLKIFQGLIFSHCYCLNVTKSLD